MAGAERVIAILDAPFEIADKEGATDAGRVEGAIAFEHVDFSYQEGSPVLKDVNFACGAGKMLALVGPTGVGKTTLTQLISRFYEPTSGRILIDGKDIQGMTLESLRRIGYRPVVQVFTADDAHRSGEVHFLLDTIADHDRFFEKVNVFFQVYDNAGGLAAEPGRVILVAHH